MGSERAEFFAGFRDVAPALPAFVPFGVVFGIAAGRAGFSPGGAVATSAVIFAGTVQFAMIELLEQDALPAVVVLTALVVGVRYSMYSASIAPYFQRLSIRWKWVLSFFLLEVTYGLTIARLTDDEATSGRWYYLGVGLPLWVAWIVTTAVGAVFAVQVPPELGLDFAVPLIFMALLFSTIEDRWTAAAGGVAAIGSVYTFALPYGLGLIVAAIVGVGGGRLAEVLAER